MHLLNGSEDLPCKMFEDALRQRSNRLYKIVKTTISSEVAHYRDTPFWTVPESVKNSDVLFAHTITLPVVHPSFEDLPDFTIADGHLLDAVNFQRRPM